MRSVGGGRRGVARSSSGGAAVGSCEGEERTPLLTEFQMPFMSDGVTVSGLWLAVTVIFLLFVASISLVIACLGGSAPAEAKAKKE